MAEYIDTAPDTFEVCCIRQEKKGETVTCQSDAKVCIAAHLKNKCILYLPICTKKGHIAKGVGLQGKLEKGADIRELDDVDIEEVFIKHRDESLKCKILQWEADRAAEEKARSDRKKKLEEGWEEPEEEAPAHRPVVPPASKPQTHEAVSYWEWVDDTDLWMDVTGETVRISKLSKEEFVSAITTICEVNLSRITKRNEWVKKLLTRRVQYLYPKDAIEVGSQNASEKLEEFFEVAEDKNWL
jgi:hypothetical protein